MLVINLCLSIYACATISPEIAKDEYTLDLKGCVKFAKTRDEAVGCFKAVNDKWDEAGARPAAVHDGGDSQ
jgi:hypothetical protein